MIEVREVFRIYPDRIKEAITLAKESRSIGEKNGMGVKVLTDLSSEFYSLIFEIETKSFDGYLLLSDQIHATGDWKQWYTRFRACVAKGKRELFTVIE